MITIPPVIDLLLRQGASLAISISGGKDSQALLNSLAPLTHRYPLATVFAIHADLGRTEWGETAAHVDRLAKEAGVPLVVVRRSQGDLLDRWQERMVKLAGTGKPFWSSAANRYCTSDLKRGPINMHLRRSRLVISAEGIRRDESPTRAKKPVVEMREAITAEALKGLSIEDALAMRNPHQRLAVTWNAIHDWSLDDVWAACGTSCEELERRQVQYRAGDVETALEGWPAHPAYVYGNQRLSCALCVLASNSDIRNGAKHNPELYQELRRMEIASGFTFKAKQSLADIVERAA
jgi:3'-phosphoadenosine 5'-phosphosulfate sulfotransferase (PAPS reductase)/FAD synthetase